jgi:G:T/U-mismatch repair DNA glycosylase
MKVIQHRFLQYPLDPHTEILIVGTFNPDTERNPAEIFYGRSRNFLWRLLPIALGESDLKNKTREEKLDFKKRYKISFIDLVAEVTVEVGNEVNYEDRYIDNKVTQWRDVISEMKMMSHLTKVCFTRKTFSDIPQVKRRIKEVESYCHENEISFQYLSTPARIYSKEKQAEWTNFFQEK